MTCNFDSYKIDLFTICNHVINFSCALRFDHKKVLVLSVSCLVRLDFDLFYCKKINIENKTTFTEALFYIDIN